MSSLKSVSKNEFEEEVLDHNGLVLVDFYTDTCTPCKKMSPILEEMAGEFSGKIKILKVNAGVNPELAKKYQIRAVPTYVLFNNGEIDKITTGAMSKSAFKKWLNVV
jgi:thioredoxin 1